MDLPDFPPRFDTDLVRPYWEALEGGELRLPACSICGSWQWYPYEFVKCHADAHHQWKPVRAEGTVFTFTKVHRCFLPGSGKLAEPYISALVIPDGLDSIRIPSLLVGLESREPEIGMRVKLKPVRRSGYTLPAFESA